METKQTSIYKMRPAGQINKAVQALPTARELQLWAGRPLSEEGEDFPAEAKKGAPAYAQLMDGFKMLEVESKGKKHYVWTPTRKYKLVQHEEAFRPIIEGLTQAGAQKFRFLTIADEKRAALQIYIGKEGHDSVMLGFEVKNSFDGSQALSYGFSMDRRQTWVEIVGYRQVCSNGMKIRVPLEEAEIVKPEIRDELVSLFKQQTRMLHTKNVMEKVEIMQYITEALTLLQEPVELFIKKAQKWKVKDEERLERLIKGHVGNRYKSRVLDAYNEEGDTTLWGLYNAMTWVASHDETIADTSRETLLEKAAVMLQAELRRSLY